MLDSMVLGVKGLNWYQSNWTADSCFCDMPPTSISRCLAAEDPGTCNCIFSRSHVEHEVDGARPVPRCQLDSASL